MLKAFILWHTSVRKRRQKRAFSHELKLRKKQPEKSMQAIVPS